jgi:polar amino acid transport system substrate-binding protein
MKKILFLSVVLLLVFLGGCTQTKEIDSLEKVKENGYIILGLDDTFAPMGFRDQNGDIVGFDIDLAKAVADKLGVELRLQPIAWDSKVLELNSGNIDMIWNGLTITEEREKQILFSQPYLNNRQIVLYKDGETMSSIEDLSGLKVGVQIESSGQEALENNAIFNSLSEMVKFDSFSDALMDLESGRIDAIVIDEIMARYVVENGSYDVLISNVSLGNEEYGIGFRLSDQSLKDAINKILQELQEDGTFGQISIKWFGEDIYQND